MGILKSIQKDGIVRTITNLWRPERYGSSYFYNVSYNAWNELDYLKAFLEIPELNAVICTNARMFANGLIKEVDANGTEVKNSKLVVALNNPNWFQSGEEFRRQTKIFRAIFGNEYMYEFYPVGREFEDAIQRGLFTIPPNWVCVEYTDQEPFFNFTETPSGVKYKVRYNNGERQLPTPNVIHLNDDRVDMSADMYAGANKLILKGESKQRALTPALNNLRMAYETRGTLLKNRGAMGILSNATSDKVGALPLPDGETERLQKEYGSNYGGLNGQRNLIITNSDLRWQQMSINPDKMGLYTETAEDFNKILDAHGSKRELFAGKDVTYENAKAAEKGVYIDTIIPDAAEWIAGFNKKHRAGAKTKLIMDYMHLPIFQEDLGKRGVALKANIDALTIALTDQAITLVEYKAELEKFGIKTTKV